jgi:peptidyl-prolyl cis-trans isomerase B (cyclophilin B)
VPSNEQRRQAAKRKLERQLARRVERAKRRKRRMALGSGIAVVVVILVVFGIVFLTSNHGSTSNAAGATSTTATPPVKTSSGPCKYTTTPSQPAPKGKDEGMPTDPKPTPNTGTVAVTLQTSQGNIPLSLDRAEAPCTVQSFVYLAQKSYFDATPCHRLTADQGLSVLQCGDPTGTGEGGPGFTIPDEKPKNLKAAPSSTPPQQGQEAPDVYPAGTIAMANTGQPHSGGSQFFLVYADSQLPPDYTVFGTIGAEGMTTLNKIVAGGITPGTDPNTGQTTTTDGKPKLAVNILKATVGS